MLSTDKAVSPINLYGATKLAAERLSTPPTATAAPPGRHLRSCATATSPGREDR